MVEFKPYTYYLYHRPTGKKYYGSETKNNAQKKAHPSNLWTTYFTSSKLVKNLIKKFGVDSFDWKIGKVFSTALEALTYENTFQLRLRVVEKEEWLNQTLSLGPYHRNGPLSEDLRAKLEPYWESRRGVPRSEEVRRKISESKKGVHRSVQANINCGLARKGKTTSWRGRHHKPETRRKISLANKGKHWYNNGVVSTIMFREDAEKLGLSPGRLKW